MGFPLHLAAHIISCISCYQTVSFCITDNFLWSFSFSLILNLIFSLLIFCLCSQFPSSFSIFLFSSFPVSMPAFSQFSLLPSLSCFLYFLSFLEKTRLKGDLITLCSQVKSDITRRNSLKLHVRSYILDIRGKFLHWKSCMPLEQASQWSIWVHIPRGF